MEPVIEVQVPETDQEVLDFFRRASVMLKSPFDELSPHKLTPEKQEQVKQKSIAKFRLMNSEIS